MFHDDPITILVGPQKARFQVPPQLLAQHSEPLNKMVSNGMKESREGLAYLPDEDPQTFQHFLDWGQSGTYRVPQTDVDRRAEYSINEINRMENLPSCVEDGPIGNLTRFYCKTCKKYRCMPANVMIRWVCKACQSASHDPGRCSKCKRRQREPDKTFLTICEDGCPGEPLHIADSKWAVTDATHRDLFWQHFDGRDRYGVGPYTHSEVQESVDKILPKVRKSFNFVAHAKVYVFAEKWLIKDLQEMAVHLLHRDLHPWYEILVCDTQNVIDLIRYIYENGQQKMGSEEVSPLKEVALEYIAINTHHLLRREEFCDLLSEGGEFAVELAKMQAKHLF